MSAIHDRWELLEPLLLLHSFRCHDSFRNSTTSHRSGDTLRDLHREHRFDETAVARAFNLLGRMEPSDGFIYLHRSLQEAADRWLVADGDHWSLRVEALRPGHEIIRWRAVTMLAPPSLIAAGALSRVSAGPMRVQILPSAIAPSSPVGHLHVHLGPMLPFEMIWTHLWRAFIWRESLDSTEGNGIETIKGDALPQIAPTWSKRQPGLRWQWTLELAMLARVWLLEVWSTGVETIAPRSLRDFARGKVDVGGRREALLGFWSRDPLRMRARTEGQRLNRARDDHERACSLTRRSRDRGRPSPQTATVTEPDRELILIADGVRRCADGQAHDSLFARIFYQYIRVKIALYGRLVVDPWTVGLRHFLDVVQRDKPYDKVIGDNSSLADARLASARSEAPLQVGALEIHTVPESWLKRPPSRPPSQAWILSFVRAAPPPEEHSEGIDGARGWAARADLVGAICRELAARITLRPSLLRELRAVSLMDWERNGPVWLFERHFRRLIDVSVGVAARYPGLRLKPLRTAFHLGEDFDHILTGLRQIYEPFAWGLVGRGDRIGHALALGLSGEDWCKRTPWVRVRPWDRILDIGFVYWALEALGLPLDGLSLERLRLEAAKAIRLVFLGPEDAVRVPLGADAVPDPLEAARCLWLALPIRPPRPTTATPPQLQWARQQLDRLRRERRVGRAALSRSLTVETQPDLAMIRAVHRVVHEKVSAMQVALEVNPSSNLLVGGFRAMFEQPVFHVDDLPISIHADDPLTFATTLADDYAYAWAGMVLMQNVTPQAATERLEAAARCSMRYAFSDPPEGENLVGRPR
jgi:hypothetical protein